MSSVPYAISRRNLWPPVQAFALALFCLALSSMAAGPLDTWQIRAQPGEARRVIYGNGRFVAANEGLVTRLLVSTNGSDWRSFLAPEAGGTLLSFDFANGNFLLLFSRLGGYYGADGQDGRGLALHSSVDGAYWTLRRFSPSTSYGVPFSSVGGGNGFYVMAGWDVSTSTNLATWEPVILGATAIRGFCYGNGTLIGSPLWGGFAVTSDGRAWEHVGWPGGMGYGRVAFAQGRFASFAPPTEVDPTNCAITVSLDGFNWDYSLRQHLTNCTHMVAANDTFFLLGGTNFYSSRNCTDWEQHSFGTNVTVTDLAYGMNCFVAVGSAVLQSGAVTNPVPVAAQLSIQNLPGVYVHGPVGQSYRIEVTRNPSDGASWIPLTNIITTSDPFLWVDTSHTNKEPRFYRAITSGP